MAVGKQAFGKPFPLSGSAGAFWATAVPIDMLRDLSLAVPYPITITGANQVVFTLNTSVSNTLGFWIGDDYISMAEAKSYIWTDAVNNILDANGTESTVTGSTLGWWYFYLYLDSGAPKLIPSQTPPTYPSGGRFGSGTLSHPGVDKTRAYVYVGIQKCTTAATPVFLAMEKLGFRYNFAEIAEATTATWAETTALFPATGPLGVKVGGSMNVGIGTDPTVSVGSTSTDGAGVFTANGDGAIAADMYFPLPGVNTTANGTLWVKDTVARGDVRITWIDDIR